MSEKLKRKSSTRRNTLIGIIIFVAMSLLALNFLQETILIFRDYFVRDTWQTTQATVLRHNNKSHWLLYEYEVNGKSYIGTRVTLTGDSAEFGQTYQDRSKFPAGREMSIFYDPNDPTRSAVRLEADFSIYIFAIGSIVFVVIAYLVGKRILGQYLGFVGSLLSGNYWKTKS